MNHRLKHSVKYDKEIAGNYFDYFVTSTNSDAEIVTAIQSLDFKNTIGGIRYAQEESGSSDLEVARLAAAMTKKCRTSRIDAGGQKSILTDEHGTLEEKNKRVKFIAEHIEFIKNEVFDGAIFGPDIKMDEPFMDALSMEPGILPHVTGLSEKRNGLSIDDNGITAFGLTCAAEAWSSETGHIIDWITVEGFGNVGANFCKYMVEEHSKRVRAVSNLHGVILDRSGSGLDISTLYLAWHEEPANKDLAVFQKAREFADAGLVEIFSDHTMIFQIPTDLFLPAARTSSIGCTSELANLENENSFPVEDFFAKAGPKLIVEGANAPLTECAEQFLFENGVLSMTDFIVNCGGLIGCWVEWKCRSAGSTADANLMRMAREETKAAVTRNIKKIIRSGRNPRDAAIEILEDP